MQKLYKSMAVIGLVAATTVTLASPMDSKRDLEGGTAGPNGDFVQVVLADKLLDGIRYDVTCNIDNPNYPKPLSIKVLANGVTGGYGYLILNGKNAQDQMNLDAANNTLVATAITVDKAFNSHASLNIENLDDSATITVNPCFATISY